MGHVGVNELARHLFTNREGIARLVEKGVLTRPEDGRYDLDECRRAYIEHLRTRPAAGATRVELDKLKAQQARLRIERETHSLVRRTEFDDAWTYVIGVLTSKLVAVPNRCSRDIEMRRTIEREIGEARNEAADEFARQSDALEQTGRMAAVY